MGILLALNDNGLCRLRFDGRFIVAIKVTDDETATYLYYHLGRFPATEHGRELMHQDDACPLFGTIFGLHGENVLVFSRVEQTGANEDTP